MRVAYPTLFDVHNVTLTGGGALSMIFFAILNFRLLSLTRGPFAKYLQGEEGGQKKREKLRLRKLRVRFSPPPRKS